MGLAKGKFEKWLEPENLLLLGAWARDGLTDEQIAGKMGISRSTLNEWKKKFSDISDTLKKGKEVVDVEVENSLLKRATGYTVLLKKTFKVKHIEYDETTGRKISEKENLETGFDEMHIPADTTAQIYWLKNRRPDKWKDKPIAEMDNSDEINENIKTLASLINNPRPNRQIADFEGEGDE